MMPTDEQRWTNTVVDLRDLAVVLRDSDRVIEISRDSVYHRSLLHFASMAAVGRVALLSEKKLEDVPDVERARKVLAVSANTSNGPFHYGDPTAAAAIVLEAKLDEILGVLVRSGGIERG